MISERTARLSPSALAQFHTRNAPEDVRWKPAAHLFELEAEIQAAIQQPRGRLAISLPPRFGKTTLLRYVMADHLGKRPDDNLMYVTHSGDKASDEGGKVRSIAAQTFGPVYGLELAADSQAKAEWKVQGHPNGGARFTGTDGDLMGRGFNLGIVDDPAGKIDEIYNADAWNKLAAWYDSVFLSRAEPGASVILVMHRWAVDDLIGQLTELDGAWRVVNFPAIRDGESLWPERWTLEELEAIRRTKTGKVWQAQYMGRPEPEGGLMYEPAWTQTVDAVPHASPRCRCWDLASSKGRGDWTAGARVSATELPEGERFFVIEDVVRNQVGPAGVEELIKRTAQQDGRWVPVGIEIEPGSTGRLYFEHLCSVLNEFQVFPVMPSGSKESRWLGMLAAAEHGALALLEGAWNKDFIAEIERLPAGKHDDQVDAAASAFNALSKKVGRAKPNITIL